MIGLGVCENLSPHRTSPSSPAAAARRNNAKVSIFVRPVFQALSRVNHHGLLPVPQRSPGRLRPAEQAEGRARLRCLPGCPGAKNSLISGCSVLLPRCWRPVDPQRGAWKYSCELMVAWRGPVTPYRGAAQPWVMCWPCALSWRHAAAPSGHSASLGLRRSAPRCRRSLVLLLQSSSSPSSVAPTRARTPVWSLQSGRPSRRARTEPPLSAPLRGTWLRRSPPRRRTAR